MRRVVGVVAADLHAGAGLDGSAHGWRQFETKKMHRRGLLVVLTVEVLVGDGIDTRHSLYLDEHTVLDADQSREFALALVDVGVFDQHRRLPVGAVGHQRRVGLDLLHDALFLEYFFDPQHFLDLVADRGLALELQVDVLSQRHRAQLAMRDHLALVRLAKLAVGLQAHETVDGDMSSDLHGGIHSKNEGVLTSARRLRGSA